MWVAGGAINNGGMILRWVRDKICHYGGSALENLDIDPYDLMTMKAEHVDAGADGLICLPYFTGERAPYWNSELRGMFFGFSLNHSRSHDPGRHGRHLLQPEQRHAGLEGIRR